MAGTRNKLATPVLLWGPCSPHRRSYRPLPGLPLRISLGVGSPGAQNSHRLCSPNTGQIPMTATVKAAAMTTALGEDSGGGGWRCQEAEAPPQLASPPTSTLSPQVRLQGRPAPSAWTRPVLRGGAHLTGAPVQRPRPLPCTGQPQPHGLLSLGTSSPRCWPGWQRRLQPVPQLRFPRSGQGGQWARIRH